MYKLHNAQIRVNISLSLNLDHLYVVEILENFFFLAFVFEKYSTLSLS